jgi:hypothetical protein
MEGLDLYLETDDGGRRCGEYVEEEGEEIDVEVEMEWVEEVVEVVE